MAKAEERSGSITTMEPYVSSLFRFVYALFPHETLTFFQAECETSTRLTAILERRLHWMRFHPALLQPPPEDHSNKEWASHSPEELLGFADELAIRSSSSMPSSLSSEFKPLPTMEGGRGRGHSSMEVVVSSGISSDVTIPITTTRTMVATGSSERPSMATSAPESFGASSRKSAFRSVGSSGDGSSGQVAVESDTNSSSSAVGTAAGATAGATAGANVGTTANASSSGVDTPPIHTPPIRTPPIRTPPQIERAVDPTALTNHLRVELQKHAFLTQQQLPQQASDVVLLSNELLYERYLREQQEWKLRSMRRRMHNQSVQVKESSILRKQLRNQMKVTGDLQAAIAKEREQAKGYKQGHKKWSADMRVKVMRQREEYLQVVERNVELQNSVNHLRETIAQLEGNLASTHTKLFTLSGVRSLYDVANGSCERAEAEIVNLRRNNYVMQQEFCTRMKTTINVAVECRDEIIERLSSQLDQCLEELHEQEVVEEQEEDVEEIDIRDREEKSERSGEVPRWLQAARCEQNLKNEGVNQTTTKVVKKERSERRESLKEEERDSLRERVHEQVDTPMVLVRLQQLILQSMEAAEAVKSGDAGDAGDAGEGSGREGGEKEKKELLVCQFLPTMQELKMLLMQEFGEALCRRHAKEIRREIELASSINPCVYGTARYVVAGRKDGGGGSKRRRSKRRRKRGSVSDELARVQIERVKRSQKVDSNHVVLLREKIRMLESRVSKMDELLCSTREMSKHRTQELERKCMSMRQVNVALERRLVLSMQENENMKIKYDEGYATTAAPG